jgi:alpha-beta hydrolase superfamily lysophospholipase
MKKIAYFIPGHGESHKRQPGYNKVADMFREKGITPIHIEIDWHSKKPRPFQNYVDQFLKKYKKPKNVEVYVLGFSFGALVAFLSEQKTKPTAIILCSLSPYFKEDLPKLPKAWSRWWKKNYPDSEYSFNELAPLIKTKILMVAGNKEGPEVDRRMRIAKKLIKQNSLTIAKEAKHRIGQKEYLAGLKRAIDTIE